MPTPKSKKSGAHASHTPESAAAAQAPETQALKDLSKIIAMVLAKTNLPTTTKPLPPDADLPSEVGEVCSAMRAECSPIVVGHQSDGMIGDIGPMPRGIYCAVCLNPIKAHGTASTATDSAEDAAAWSKATKAVGKKFLAGQAEVPSDLSKLPSQFLEAAIAAPRLDKDETRLLLPEKIKPASEASIVSDLVDLIPGLNILRLGTLSQIFDLSRVAKKPEVFTSYLFTELFPAGREIFFSVMKEYAARSAGYAMGVVDPVSKAVNRKWIFSIVSKSATRITELYQPGEWTIPDDSFLEIMRRKVEIGTPADLQMNLRVIIIQAAVFSLIAERRGVCKSVFITWKRAFFTELDRFYEKHIEQGGNRILMKRTETATPRSDPNALSKAIKAALKQESVKSGTPSKQPNTRARHGAIQPRVEESGTEQPKQNPRKPPKVKSEVQQAALTPPEQEALKFIATRHCFIDKCAEARQADECWWCEAHSADRKGLPLKAEAKTAVRLIKKRGGAAALTA